MIIQILSAVFLLGVCIFFHELGHFLAGKLVGVQPRIFSIGYGRALWFKRKGKTIYQVTAIPIGGYVQFYGDDITKDHSKAKKGHFFSVGPWKRIVIALGGPVFSVLLGLVVIFILFASGWQPITNKISVLKGMNAPAEVAGLQAGDRILSVNGHKTESFEELNYYIAYAENPELDLEVERDGVVQQFHINAQANEGEPLFIGIRPAGKEFMMVRKNVTLGGHVFQKDDKIISVDGVEVSNTEELRTILDAKTGSTVKVVLKRSTGSLLSPGEEETKQYDVPVKAAEPLLIGISPAGKEFMMVRKNVTLGGQVFQKDDKIISVDGVEVSNIEELRIILDAKIGSIVKVVIKRSTGSLLSPGEEETKQYDVPVKAVEFVEFTEFTDLQTGKTVPVVSLGSWEQNGPYQHIRIQGQSYNSWKDFKAALNRQNKEGSTLEFKVRAVPVRANFAFKTRGMLGISLSGLLEPDRANLPTDFVSILERTVAYPVFVVKSTLLGIYRIFQGRISFSKNVSGPVKIMAIAAESVNMGWSTYWFLLANITIVLGVMNLLPIPVLDGGHIILYLIEAVYKPLSPKAIGFVVRMGMVFLLTLGAYVIWLDLSDLFKRFLAG
ncbi:MAG: site-2 protease family protein [Leptospirales bacterium]